jgi:hypothetical protein
MAEYGSTSELPVWRTVVLARVVSRRSYTAVRAGHGPRRVELVVGVQEEEHVERVREHRVRHVVALALVVHLVQEPARAA